LQCFDGFLFAIVINQVEDIFIGDILDLDNYEIKYCYYYLECG